MYAKELEELVGSARQLTIRGRLVEAREHWRTALKLVPAEAPEAAGILREIARLDARISPQAHKIDWKKRLGPLGVVLAAIAKFKTTILLLLTKGKFLLSVLAFVGVYWSLFGWPFAVGLTGSVLLHEMGHYLVVRRFGFRAELPMFLPGLGAYVKWNGANVDPGVRAQISLAGPLFGLFSGLIAYALFVSTHYPVLLAIAQFAGWLNLLNLIPVSIFDGGSAMSALGKQSRFAILLVSAVLFFLFHEFVFALLAIGTAYRLWKKDFPQEDRQGIAYYFMALVLGNGFLSWFCTNQARILFAR